MTRTGKRLIQDFIIPALDAHKYGELLQWVDHTQKVFQIKWSHKNAARWSCDDTNVFQDWDRLKGHYKPEKAGYYMQAKQRFRAALQKLKNYVRRLEYEEKGFKRYKLLDPVKKQPKSEKEKKKNGRKIVQAIPTSVICHHTSYNGNVASTSSSSSPSSYYPSSPSSTSLSQESNPSISSDVSAELEMLEQSYKSAQERQMRAYEMDASMKDETMSDEGVSDSEQKENLKIQTLRDPPHAPIESVCNMIPFYENFSTPRFESPKFLLVRTHYESRPPRPMGNYNVGCVADPTSALNLSVKHEVK